MFIARLYLDRAIALPSDSLNEPAIQPTDTISGPANFPSRCVFLSLVPRILHRSSCTIFSRLAAGVASYRPSTPTREPRSVSQSNEFRCAILTRCCCFYARSLYFSAAALLMMIVLACSKRLSIEKRLDRLLKHYVAAKCKT